MSILERIADRLGEIQKEMLRDRHPFLTAESAGFSRKWVLKENGLGCRPVKAQAAISMAKNPPPLPGSPPPAAKAPSTLPANSESPSKATPASPTVASALAGEPDSTEDCPQPPPFDMLEIPDGMDAMGFSYAARCARRWFNGSAHVIADKSKAIVQPAFVDDSSCKLQWVLKFGKVRRRYDQLLATNLKSTTPENIYNDAARNDLGKNLQHFMVQSKHQFSGVLDTLAACGNDKQLLHQRFQFQRVVVSVPDVLGNHTTVMNDLAASLANFHLYAAVATAKISRTQYNRYDTHPWRQCVRASVEITHIYVYVKDVYSFNDRQGSTVSQYLGHWNRQGVIITVDAALAEQISKLAEFLEHERDNIPRWYVPPIPDYLDKPVDIKSSLRKPDVFYPVRNRDFQHWRNLKGRGGDFVIFSDLERIALPKPIELDLGETCWEYTR